ncbi:hypothetical protein DPMN_038456 [Dreissena polymorpha]|uniref:Uncharacterized protein n=1 Tax=Dreissena polymorpha TaxID=45954 RepID=A0A9D4ME99_DREPO|nr:hypothetical protein DPMN_038456 [Dreissena polymorpha]
MCTLINCLGYGPHIRQARGDAYRKRDRLFNARGTGILTQITTESKAEGLSGTYESDRDKLFVVEGIMC